LRTTIPWKHPFSLFHVSAWFSILHNCAKAGIKIEPILKTTAETLRSKCQKGKSNNKMQSCHQTKKEDVVMRPDDSEDKKYTQNSQEKVKDGNGMKNTDSDVNVESSYEAKETHYSIFCILFMLGFLIHCRKYPEDSYSSITMAHIVTFISVPRVSTTLYQDVTFLSFISYCLFTMLQDSPYNANHHNMYVSVASFCWSTS
jgi:hypothetical protein